MIKIVSDKEYTFWIEQRDTVKKLKEHIDFLEKQYAELIEKISKSPSLADKDRERLADLEVKMAKLWSLLIQCNDKGTEKLSKFGKRFGGQSKQFL